MKRNAQIIPYILGTVFLILANITYIAAHWAVLQFPDMDFTTIAFHLKVPLQGTNTSAFKDIIVKVYI